MVTRKQLEDREKKILAPYAVLACNSKGRIYPESEDDYRTCFQHDRDRIIHSKAFRRLAGKTQVFVATFGDHYRDRLTHTLEMAQVSRDLARSLRLNEDLAEAIALAHDLGHTPFGHAGEDTLNRLMSEFGMHFEHNEQSRRIVEKLEERYPSFPGLNLSHEVRDGLAKHQTHYDQKGKKINGKTLEAEVVDLADEIAYHTHDLDDGLRSKLFRLDDLRSLSLYRDAEKAVHAQYGEKISKKFLRHRVIAALMAMMMLDVVEEAERRVAKYKIQTLDDVINCRRGTVIFSDTMKKKVKELKEFLWQKMYQSPEVLSHSHKGQRILEHLFTRFHRSPALLPAKLRKKIAFKVNPEHSRRVDTLPVVVKDYVAGMTDSYATMVYRKMIT